MSIPLVALVGPTGTGKSALSLRLVSALRERGDEVWVINADAMQLYRGMDIGTAKLTRAERSVCPHHLFDLWPVTQEASVADYQEAARAVITEAFSQGAVPVLVGGSGLYVSSVLYAFDFPGTDPEVRHRLELRLQREGSESLARELAERDPEAAAAIDPRNARRVIRALEVIELTGEPFGAGLRARQTLWHEPTIVVGLERERRALTQALDERVQEMWRQGLVEEVRLLRAEGLDSGVTASQAIGYRQAIAFLDGQMSEQEAIAETQSLTRRYARRQMSWFRRDPRVTWFKAEDADLPERVLRLMDQAGIDNSSSN